MPSSFFWRFFLLILILPPLSNAHASLPEPWPDMVPEVNRDQRDELENLANQAGAVGDYFKLKLAEKQLKTSQTLEAFKTVSRVQEPLFLWWKNVIEAEVFVDQSKFRETLALLHKLPAKPKPELSFGEVTYQNLYKRALISRVLAKQNLKEDSAKDIARFASLFPKDESLKKILGLPEDTQPTLTKQNKIDKLHALFFSYQYKDVPGLISTAEIKSSKIRNEHKCRAFYELGISLKNTKTENTASMISFQEILTSDCGDYYTPRALYWSGILANSENDSATAEKYFTKLYQDFPNNRLADDAIYHLHQMAEKNQNASQAKKYHKMLTELGKGDMRCKFFFDDAYALFKKDEFKKAADLFTKAVTAEPTEDESYPQALYWQGRSLEKTGDKKNRISAMKSYQRVLREFPFSFYAILSARRMNTNVAAPNLPRLNGNMPETGISYFALIDDFNQKGYHEIAGNILDLALHAHPEWEQTHKEYLAKKLIESGNYRKAIEIASEHFDSGVYGPIKAQTDPLFAAFYPLAYQDKIKIGHNHSTLPQGAIQGIMREESLFQKNARSWVGATGLMQLMPTTAQLVRKELPGNVLLDQDLTDTETNIILGSTYLQNMKNYFDGQLPLAIMAYNAGPGTVRKWVRNFGDLELDEFIETIPLSETRGYVKRVMRSMYVYGRLYNESYFKEPDYFDFHIKRKNKL